MTSSSSQIEEMLQKEPGARPSAAEIRSARLPLLLEESDDITAWGLPPEEESTPAM